MDKTISVQIQLKIISSVCFLLLYRSTVYNFVNKYLYTTYLVNRNIETGATGGYIIPTHTHLYIYIHELLLYFIHL